MSEVPSGVSAARYARMLTYAATAMVCLGLIIIYLGYNGAATHTSIVQQFPYLLSGGMVGLALVLAGAIAGLGAVMQRAQDGARGELVELRQVLEDLTDALSQTAVADVGADGTELVAVSRGGSSFHRDDCRLVAAKPTTRPMSRTDAQRRGLMACRICNP